MGGNNGNGISQEQQDALNQAALAISTATTRPDEIVHHYLSGEDLQRIQHAAKTDVGTWLQLAIGAAVGNVLATLAAIGTLFETKGDPSLLKDFYPFVPIGLEVVFVATSIVLFLVQNRRGADTVEAICGEIRNRKKDTRSATASA